MHLDDRVYWAVLDELAVVCWASEWCCGLLGNFIKKCSVEWIIESLKVMDLQKSWDELKIEHIFIKIFHIFDISDINLLNHTYKTALHPQKIP